MKIGAFYAGYVKDRLFETSIRDQTMFDPTIEYIKLELCGLTSAQAKIAQTAILSLISEIGLNEHSCFIREKQTEYDSDFEPVFSTTFGVED